MERRGFIGKFAKAAAGAALLPEILLEEKRGVDKHRFRLPRIIRVRDETAMRGDTPDLGAVRAMFTAGLMAFRPDVGKEDIIDTLFPGLGEGETVGIKVYAEPEYPPYLGGLLTCLIDIMESMPHREGTLNREDIIVWSGKDLNPAALGMREEQPPGFQIRNGEEDEIDPDYDEPLDMGGFSLGPYPLLSRLCRFQMAMVSAAGDLSGKRVCRDAFLSCFRSAEYPDWPHSAEEAARSSALGKAHYPLSMKFRLFIVERLKAEGALYLGGDIIHLDNLLGGAERDEPPIKVEVVTIENPSAPIIDDISVRRRGDDFEIRWEYAGYEGEYQVYRGGEPEFIPCRRLLVGITNRRIYTDFGGAKLGSGYYRVTRGWG